MNDKSIMLDPQQVLNGKSKAVGGKAWQLARLHCFGLPVPEFIVLPTWAGHGPETLGAIIAILAAKGWLDRPLAVRSSADDEDGSEASFAGIFHSRLNVLGETQLCQAITDVRASLDTPIARAYRDRLGLNGEISMAVIIMPMIQAQAAGIAFTCDPLTGRDDRLVIHANWGLGEALVSGRATGDEYICAENTAGSWHPVEQRWGTKTVMTLPHAAGGTQTVPVPPERATQEVLSPGQVEELANLLYDAALALDFSAAYYDFEWAWDGRKFWLVQGRPITSRPYRTYPALHDEPVIWTRGNTCEVVPEPLSPIDWSLSRWGVNSLLEQGWRLVGYPLLAGAQRAGLFDGRLYLEASILQWEAWDAMGIPPASLNALMGGHQPAIEPPPPTRRQRMARLGRILRFIVRAPAARKRGEAAIARIMAEAGKTQRARQPSDSEALRAAFSRQSRITREATDLHFLQGSSGGSLTLLIEVLEKRFPGEGVALSSALQSGGEPSVTARQGYDLLALARLVARPEVGAQPLADPNFAQAFQTFLEAYGHRGSYETYFRSPRLWEDPGAVLDQVLALAEVDEADLHRRQQTALQAVRARLRASLPIWTRAWVQMLNRAAKRECNQREAARSALVAQIAATRAVLLATADWMLHAGILRQQNDIYLLTGSEIERALAGQIPAAGVLARVVAREAVFRHWQETEPPEYLVLHPDGKVRVGGIEPPCTSTGQATWRGVATGTGIGRGRVRILRHPDQGTYLQPGEILVAPSTDPGWMPLFLRAGGLVVETGGYLSHGAIVAREFALPVVVNLPGILDSLQDGDRVEVDGLRGEVRRLEE